MTKGNVTASGKDIKWYVEMTNRRRKYPCNKCEWKCVSKDSLSKHIHEKHNGPRPFVCDQCDKTYSSKPTLVEHVKVKHNNIKDYKCDICDYKTGYKGYIINHIKRHQDERLYECYECELNPYKGKTAQDLYYHIKYVNN